MKMSANVKPIVAALVCLFLSGCGTNVQNTDLPKTSESPTTIETMPLPETTLPVTEIPTPTPLPTPSQKPAVPVMITKSPSGESVVPEGKTWFIAHAENAESLEWLFTNPSGETFDAEEVTLQLPGLEVEVLPEDTIALRNIPLEMDGWTIQARFDGAGTSAVTDPALITVTDILSEYADILAYYREVMNYGFDSEQVAAYSYLGLGSCRDCIGNEFSTTFGYFLRDMDWDGIPELFVSATGEVWYGADQGIIYSMHTIIDGEVRTVFSGWARNRYQLTSDGYIYNEGSGGASNSSSCLLLYSGGQLTAEDSMRTDGVDESGNIIAYRGDERISFEQYMETAESWRNTVSPPELIPIS